MTRTGGYFDRLIQNHNAARQTNYVSEFSDNLRTLIKADHFRMLYELTTSRFQWLNMPDTVTHRYVEQTLANTGCVIFFKDDDSNTGRFWCLQGNGIGALNPNGEYSRFQITAPFWVGRREFTSDEAVAIYSNYSRMSDLLRVQIYAQRLTEIDVTFDVNANNIRRTRAVLSDQDRRLTNRLVIDAIDRGDPVIEVTQDFRKEDFQVVDFGGSAQQLVDIHIAKQRIMGDAMSALGINNANQDKKERNVVDEVNANNDQIVAMRQSPLDCREDAVRLINSCWPDIGLQVRFRELVQESRIPETPMEVEPTE